MSACVGSSVKPTEHYGKDCPKGMVQVEFVGCSPAMRHSDYGWKPVESAFIEVYIDGNRYRIDIGTDHKGRRGLSINGPMDMVADKHSVNAVFVGQGKKP